MKGGKYSVRSKGVVIKFFLFLVFLTSSFDIFLNIHIAGFNLRFVFIPILILSLLWLKALIKMPYPKIILPKGALSLLVWLGLNIVFIPHSPLIIRSLAYTFWIFFDILFVFIVVNVVKREWYVPVLKFYLLSFFIIALIGLLQFVLPIFHFPTFYVRQWWISGILPRINGFNYEPSYYATYLVPGFALTLLLYLKNINLGWSKHFLLLMVATELLALILCSSRMGYLSIVLLIVIILTKQFFQIIVKLTLNKKVIFMLILMLFFAISGLAFLIHEGKGINRFLAGTGLMGSSSHSVSSRLVGMKDTWKVFVQSPLIGYSMGGVAPAIGQMRGNIIKNNADAKANEGNNIFIEILAGTGVVGFLFFMMYLFSLYFNPIIKKSSGNLKTLVRSMLIALFLELFLLSQNQNILRPYLWIQLGMLSLTLRYIEKAEDLLLHKNL